MLIHVHRRARARAIEGMIFKKLAYGLGPSTSVDPRNQPRQRHISELFVLCFTRRYQCGDVVCCCKYQCVCKKYTFLFFARGAILVSRGGEIVKGGKQP